MTPPQSPDGQSDQPRQRLPGIYIGFTGFLVLACLALCVLVVFLTAENRRLKAGFGEAIEGVGSTGLMIGEPLPPLEAVAVKGLPPPDGQPAPIAPLEFTDGRRGTLLLLTSGSCDACGRSLPYFKAVAESRLADGIVCAELQIDAASMEGLVHEGSAALPSVAVRDASSTWLRRVPMVPGVLVLDSRGALRKSYYGVLSPRQQSELNEVLSQLVKGADRE